MGPVSITSILLRREIWRQTAKESHGERKPCENRSRDYIYTASNQGVPRITSILSEIRRD